MPAKKTAARKTAKEPELVTTIPVHLAKAVTSKRASVRTDAILEVNATTYSDPRHVANAAPAEVAAIVAQLRIKAFGR